MFKNISLIQCRLPLWCWAWKKPTTLFRLLASLSMYDQVKVKTELQCTLTCKQIKPSFTGISATGFLIDMLVHPMLNKITMHNQGETTLAPGWSLFLIQGTRLYSFRMSSKSRSGMVRLPRMPKHSRTKSSSSFFNTVEQRLLI